VYPSSKMFAKLVNKNAIKHQKGVPSHKIFSQPLYTLPPKIWQKPHGPSPLDFQTVCIYVICVKHGCLDRDQIVTLDILNLWRLFAYTLRDDFPDLS
jgi:hypothetical protein